MWVRIFYKGSKYKGAVKAAFCEIESNDLMWHDFFWIKHYGAKKPVPEKLARKAKRVGFAQPGEWRHGVRTYFSWRKERQSMYTYVRTYMCVRTYTRTYVRTYVPYAFDNCTCATRFLTPSVDLRHAHLQRFETSYCCAKCHQTNELSHCNAPQCCGNRGSEAFLPMGQALGQSSPDLGGKCVLIHRISKSLLARG